MTMSGLYTLKPRICRSRQLMLTIIGLTILVGYTRNRNLKISKAPLKSQAHQGTSLITSAATNQRGVSKGGQEKLGGSREAQVLFSEHQEGTEELLRWVSFRWRR